MENTIPPLEVSRIIVEAVTSDNPEFRYLVGKVSGKKTVELRKWNTKFRGIY